MFERNTPRFIIIGIVILVAIWALIPSFRYQMLSPEEKAAMPTSELRELEKRIIRRGLDLQGGIYVVLEVDIPTLIEKLAVNRNPQFYEIFDAAKKAIAETDQSFTEAFVAEADRRGVRLNRHFPDFGRDNKTIREELESKSADAINRALEILNNRVDQFGVSEPTIQKQGNRRIIVELAGIQDPDRARALLQSTALLEFVLLKDPEITSGLLTRIDRALKGSEMLGEVLPGAEGEPSVATADTVPVTPTRTVEEKEIPFEEIFADTSLAELGAEDTSTVLVDKELFQDRPFSSLLRALDPDIGVPERNREAVERILAMDETKSILEATDSRFAWSSDAETWTSADGSRESFYRLYHLDAAAQLTGGVVTKAKETLYNGQPIVTLSMNSEGAKDWSRITGSNVGRRLAIVLDRKVHMAPTIKTKISNGVSQVEGFADMAEAQDIAIVLRAGSLPTPLMEIDHKEVGPSLGQDSTEKGTRSIIVGLIVVLLFMTIYYRLSGVIADVALVWNLILVLAVLAMLKATLTLPGIAGLILTVGMSVDANVIIFERIREELAKGKTVRAAIDSGYARALTTIIDANVTTVLAALILMQFGTGPIKGFAVVLFWGIAISMFTAIFFTRTIFNAITSRRSLQTLSI